MDLEMKVMNRFNLNELSLSFERYHQEYQTYAMIDLNSCEVEDKWRLRVSPITVDLSTSFVNAIQDFEVHGSVNPNEVLPMSSSNPPPTYFNMVSTSRPTMSLPTSLPNTSVPVIRDALPTPIASTTSTTTTPTAQTMSTSTTSTSSVPGSALTRIVNRTLRGWPEDFTIDTQYMAPSLVARLDSTTHISPFLISPKDSGTIVHSIREYIQANYVTRITNSQNKLIQKALFLRWPQLEKLPAYSPTYWHTKFVNAFKNNEASRKRELIKSGAAQPASKVPKLTPQEKQVQIRLKYLGSYCPTSRLPGDDDEALEAHFITAQQEPKKVSPNEAALNDSMDHTFYDRRQFIVVQHAPLKDVLARFPDLSRGIASLSREYDRIQGGNRPILARFQINAHSNTSILNLPKTKKEKMSNMLAKLREYVDSKREGWEDVRLALSHLITVVKLRNKIEDILVEEEGQAINSPKIVCPGLSQSDEWYEHCSVILDNCPIVSGHFNICIQAWLMSFDIFNLVVPQAVHLSHQFMSKVLLEADVPKIDNSVNNLLISIARS